MKVHLINSSPYEANAFLLDAPKPVLIDVGMNASYVIDRISDIIEPNDIETIVLTHAHYDHWGGVEEVKQATGAKIAIHKADAVLLQDDVSNVASMFGKRAVLKADTLLNQADYIELGEGNGLEVIHTPGHTPGSICLYHAESKSLFSGDTVFTGGSFGRTDLTGGSMVQLIESLKYLSGLEVGTMYPGHGDVASENVDGQIKLSLHLAGTYL
jgi:hydroxyacylglutathione hydrolase